MTAPVDLSRDVNELAPGVIALRRELHRHPELAFEEVWTAATLAGSMRALGLVVEEGIGGTGVLAMLEGFRPGRTLLVRTDIDGLAMDDATGREYASTLPNRCRACGHDVHAAVVAGVAEVLARHRGRLAGRVAFVFQPADEPMRGARRMIEDGLLERVRPDMSMSLHVLPMLDAGQVVIQRGPIWASWDTRLLRFGGPATIDVVRVAAQVTIALHELVEREGQSPEPVIFRVRSLRAEQTARGDRSQAAIEVHLGHGESAHATIEVNLAVYDNGLRSLHHVTGALERAAWRVVGPANVVKGWRHRFSDDFGLFLAAAPGCLMLLGTANADKGITEIWHRPGFGRRRGGLADRRARPGPGRARPPPVGEPFPADACPRGRRASLR